jgi:hypothetical protein
MGYARDVIHVLVHSHNPLHPATINGLGAWVDVVLCDCEAIAYLRFRHLDQFFIEPSDFSDAP